MAGRITLVLSAALLASAALPLAARAQQTQSVDARAPSPPTSTGYLKLGTAASPRDGTLGVTSRYLTRNGRPWLPVMGEVHFVRLPHDEWRAELMKMKLSGVDIVATYLFWNYHEATPGTFDWSGDRDVRAFVKLAGDLGLKVVIRLGPWAHGEVRYGGIPDWVVDALPTRSSDPAYMRYVDRYWGEIAHQLGGLLWKDGGPVIGVQLENEFNLTGPRQGREHIADLKALALKHGFDVPFYTVTGWDGTIYPPRDVAPVFGGYPDEPWGTTTDRLPPKETYAFRFDSRVSGNLGAQTQGKAGDAEADATHTPFLGAEYGGGVPTMYRRRPVIRPDDIAAMLPVQLGSGVNLYGYYMYHGGRNLIGGTTLEENTAIGGFNDLPLIEYDFQAPYGEYGEASPVLDYIRPYHLFLRSYGERLAPMTVRRPAQTPSGNDDLRTLRWSVRASDDAAFVFVNNHVRQFDMAAQTTTRFTVKLRGGDVTFPSKPVTIPNHAYFIWPVGLDLGGVTLRWASAQPVTRIDNADGTLHVFAASDGIAPEFAFPKGTQVSGGHVEQADDDIVVTAAPGMRSLLTVRRADGTTVRILVLSMAQARQVWRVRLSDADHLVLGNVDVVEDGTRLSLTSMGDPHFAFSTWPALPGRAIAGGALRQIGSDGVFTRYAAALPARTLPVTITRTHAPGLAPKVALGGRAAGAIEPYPETFGAVAGTWAVDLPKAALAGLDDAILSIDWVGDVGRLYDGVNLADDRFFDGRPWRIGLKRLLSHGEGPLTLRVLPLRGDAPIYIDDAVKPKLAPQDQRAEIVSAHIEPRYRLDIEMRPASQ